MVNDEKDWRAMREARGLSLSEVSRRTGIQKAYLSMIETHRMVAQPGEARKLLRVLDKEEETT